MQTPFGHQLSSLRTVFISLVNGLVFHVMGERSHCLKLRKRLPVYVCRINFGESSCLLM